MRAVLSNRKLLIGIVIVLVVAIAGGGFYIFKKNQKTTSTFTLGDKQQSAQDQVAELISEVGKLMDLPKGEEPTVATITDINKLKDQPLFSKGSNGDKVLIYATARKAILYDPVGNRIVDVETIDIGSSSATQVPSSAPQSVTARIAVLNGTTTGGLAAKTASLITSKFPQAAIVSKGNAQGSSYSATLVIPVSNAGKAQAQSLASGLGVKAQMDLPAGESAPTNSDILVIVGADLAK